MLKTKGKVHVSLAGLILATSVLTPVLQPSHTSAEACTTSPCNTTFQVNIKESLSVTIANDHVSESTGDTGQFLRNKIDVSVSTNNANGFVAFMHSQGTTNLTNAINNSYTIPTLGSSKTRSSFDDNRWGYNLTKTTTGSAASGADTPAGNPNSTYGPMATSNITLIQGSAGTTSGNQSIYFGTKTNISQAAGTYLGTVVINVVTGTNTMPSGDPDNPATPSDDTPSIAGQTDNGPTYDSANRRTVHTITSTTSNVTTTTTQVSEGDTTSLYADPQGEIMRTDSSISNNGSAVATGLAVAATVAAASGAFFFILAKRKEDEEEDEAELQS